MPVIQCPNCQTQLKIKPEYSGRVGRCPKCSGLIKIPPSQESEASAETEAPSGSQEIETENFPPITAPDRLVPWYHYLICDRTRVLGTWENNSRGWQIKSGTQMLPARQNQDKLPPRGKYVLVELQFEQEDEGHKLVGIVPYELADRYALTRIAKGQDAILHAIRGLASLNREQKAAIMEYLRGRFMRDVWADDSPVKDYLTNIDYQSPGIGEPSHPLPTGLSP